MKFYPPKIGERFDLPANSGRLQNENAAGIGVSFVCGSFVRIYLRIESPGKRIEAAKFQTDGCGYMIAAADILAGNLIGCYLTDLHGVDSNQIGSWFAESLEEFPKDKMQCSDHVIEALKNALAEYRINAIDEFQGEKALICTCFGVSEEKIIEIIDSNNVKEVGEVSDICNAGRGCGSCQVMIRELIDSHRPEEA
ncbi:MAG: iron-sulfur cluster assembly scaffold protein [Saprospiraceae bacterium]|nr:iron-sulfur cluster assembly scaffold protein [Pyrinomonadaceae bacterium]